MRDGFGVIPFPGRLFPLTTTSCDIHLPQALAIVLMRAD